MAEWAEGMCMYVEIVKWVKEYIINNYEFPDALLVCFKWEFIFTFTTTFLHYISSFGS